MRGVRRGFLKYYILKLLTEDSYSGYGLIKAIEEETGFWKPSTGSVYPLLEDLEADGLIEGETMDRGNSWGITEEGEKAYEEATEAKEKMRESIKQSMIVFSQIFNEEKIREDAKKLDDQFENPSGLRKKIRLLHHRLNDLLDEESTSPAELSKVVEMAHKRLDELEQGGDRDEQGN